MNLIERRELFIFVGAAISMAKPSGLPDFRKLQNEIIWALCHELEPSLRNTYQHVYEEIGDRKVTTEIASRFLTIVPEYLFALCKRGMLHKQDADYYELQPLNTFRNRIPNQNHLTIAKLLTGGHIPAVFTTNFDLLIESAVDQIEHERKQSLQITKYWRVEHFNEINGDSPKLFKLHGCIDDFESIVITLDEIGKRAVFGSKSLAYFLENHYVLVSGYRGADIDIFSYFASAKCRGIIWNDLSEENILPKVKSLLKKQNGNVVTGDLGNIFSEISCKLDLGNLDVDYDIKSEPIHFEQEFAKWASKIEMPSRICIIGDLWEYLGERTVAKEFFASGLESTFEIGNELIHNVFLGRLAALSLKRRKYKEANDYCLKMLHNAESFPRELRLHEYIDTKELMGLIEAKQDIKRGVDLLIESLGYQEQLEKIDENTRYLKGDILLNVGKMLQESRLFDDAMGFYQDALASYDEFGNIHGRARILANVGSVLLERGRFDDCIRHYKEAEYLFSETGDIFGLSKILLNLTKTYYNADENHFVREYAPRAMAYFEILTDEENYNIARELLRRCS